MDRGTRSFAAERVAVPLVASFHTNVPEYTEALSIGWLRPITQKAITFLHNRAAINLCTSGPMVDKARDMGIHTVRLWPKAVDTQAYRPDNYDAQMRSLLTGGHPETPLVTYIGRISHEKDMARLNEVMRQVRTRVPAARLALIGAGPTLEELRAQFDSATTVFTGFLSGSELQTAFAVGDVFAFPSATETLGLVALESFASGVPVVGTYAGGIPFVIEREKTGLLVDEGATDEQGGKRPVLIVGGSKGAPTHGARRARRSGARYSWRESTKALVAAYEYTCRHPYHHEQP